MKALSAAVFLILVILIAGCGSQGAQPAPTNSSSAQLPTEFPELRPHRCPNQRQPRNHRQPPRMFRRPLARRRPLLSRAQPSRLLQRTLRWLRHSYLSLDTKRRFCVRCPPGTWPACHRTYEPMNSFGSSWDSSLFTTILKVMTTLKEEKNYPEFNCMSDDGKFRTYVMGWFEQHTVFPEDYQRLPESDSGHMSGVTQNCPRNPNSVCWKLWARSEHPQRGSRTTTEAWEVFNGMVLVRLHLHPNVLPHRRRTRGNRTGHVGCGNGLLRDAS